MHTHVEQTRCTLTDDSYNDRHGFLLHGPFSDDEYHKNTAKLRKTQHTCQRCRQLCVLSCKHVCLPPDDITSLKELTRFLAPCLWAHRNSGSCARWVFCQAVKSIHGVHTHVEQTRCTLTDDGYSGRHGFPLCGPFSDDEHHKNTAKLRKTQHTCQRCRQLCALSCKHVCMFVTR